MKVRRIITLSALAVAAFAPVAAFADEISSTTTTVQEAVPSTTVIEKQPVIVAPEENKTTIVDKRKRKHLISLPFVHVF